MTAVARVRPGLVLFVLAIVLGSFVTFRGDYGGSVVTPFTIAACIGMIVGQQLPTHLGQRVIAPLTTAPALGLMLAPLDFGGVAPSAATVLGIVWVSILAGALLRRARGRTVVEGSLGARFFGMALSAYLAREAVIDGHSLVEWAFSEKSSPAVGALALLMVAAAGGLLERALDEGVVWLGARGRPPSVVVGDLYPFTGVAVATASTGPLIALAQPVLDWVAIPLLVLPVFLAQLSVQRVWTSRRDLQEALLALSRLTEVAHLTRPGHPRRVAQLAVAIGARMDLDARSLRQIERAALLHDVGQLGLDEPLTNGATLHAGPEEEDRIAETGTAIIGSSPQLATLVPLLDHIRTPFRRSREFGAHIPLESRIVRVANAWDDLTEGARSPRVREVALERLHLSLGYEYDPDVVAALEEVLEVYP